MPYRRIDEQLGTRHPFQVFILIFTIAVGVPTLLGISPPPGSIQSFMAPLASFLWALALVGGSSLALGGIYWKERATGLIAEQLGLAFAGVASLIYGMVAVYEVGLSALVPAGIIVGFGVACFGQYRRIQGVLDDVHKIQEQQKRDRGKQ